MKMKPFSKVAIGISVAAFAATTAYAFNNNPSQLNDFLSTVDLDAGGSYSQNSTFLRTITFSITSDNASRAELRRNAQNSGKRFMSGKMALKAEGSSADKLSVIQVLTITDANATSGPAKPNEQLAIRKTGNTVNGKKEWEFYLVQTSGQPDCTGIKFVRGETLTVRMEYEKGKKPKFRIKKGRTTSTCTSGTSQLVGSNREGNTNRYYYGKMGVYATSSGRGSAQVRWGTINDSA